MTCEQGASRVGAAVANREKVNWTSTSLLDNERKPHNHTDTGIYHLTRIVCSLQLNLLLLVCWRQGQTTGRQKRKRTLRPLNIRYTLACSSHTNHQLPVINAFFASSAVIIQRFIFIPLVCANIVTESQTMQDSSNSILCTGALHCYRFDEGLQANRTVHLLGKRIDSFVIFLSDNFCGSHVPPPRSLPA